jgi:hypothetical protein
MPDPDPVPAITSSAPAPLIALAGWLVPGSGYFLVGQKLRGTVIGVTIITLFLSGVLLGGVRVVDVPGYDDLGRAEYVRFEQDSVGHARELKTARPAEQPNNGEWRPVSDWRWILRAHPFPEIANKPWFVGQILSGPICLAAARVSLEVSHPPTPGAIASATPRSHARISEIGTLYTAVAGMLNLLAIIDAAYRAGQGAR